MIVDIVKHIEIALTAEEKETLQKTHSILNDIIETTKQNLCQYIICQEEYGDNLMYTINDIDDVDGVIDALVRITEIM